MAMRNWVLTHVLVCVATAAWTPLVRSQAAPAAEGQPPILDIESLKLESTALAAVAGYYATPAQGQKWAFNGSDLGWTFAHRDKLWVMFGDSWWIDPFNLVGRPDDALAHISLSRFPTGESVEAYVRTHPAPQGEPAWRAASPPLQVVLRKPAWLGFAPVVSEAGGKGLRSGIGAVPIIAFANGRDDAGEGMFAVFFHYEAVNCNAGRCRDGYACDPGLGLYRIGMLTPPCVVGSSWFCAEGPGICQDRGTNRYTASTQHGRTTATLMRHAVGVTTPAEPTRFQTQPWETARFLNATGRTVTNFDPERAEGIGNDYTPARGNDLARAGLFMWGRPHFAGTGREGRDLRLYLAWVPMPAPDNERHFEWKPQFFAGIDDRGRPQFSARELDARALDLDAHTPGDQPSEAHDFAGHMNVVWLPSLQHFVMFYGGDSPGFSEGLLAWDDSEKIQRDEAGRLWVRFARNPWGPWTAPRALLRAGDRSSDAEPVEQFAPGGILAHENCKVDSCARYDPLYYTNLGHNDNGLLYAPSIIDAWTTASDESTTLYWFVSTWNPYQVVLMKTTFRR